MRRFVLLMICCVACLGMSRQNSLAVHEAVGDVIDSQENLRLGLFGEIPGFSAARFYEPSEHGVKLQMARNTDSTAQLLTLTLDRSRFDRLQDSVKSRISRPSQTEVPPLPPLFPVDAKKWQRQPAENRIVLNDGSVLLGVMQQARSDTLFVRTLGGISAEIPMSHISTVEALHADIREGKFYRIDPNTTRLLFGPTGRNLKAGQAYFADYYVFFPTLAYGATNWFSLSAGMSLLPGADSQLFYVAPKLTVPLSTTVGLGAGFMHIGVPEEDGLSLAFAVVTGGRATASLTAGVGVPFSQNLSGTSIILLGGEVQTSNSVKLVTENWIFVGEENTAVFSGGIRFFSDKMAVDLALLTMAESFGEGGFPFLPWVDFSIFFGSP